MIALTLHQPHAAVLTMWMRIIQAYPQERS
jgi:hypothetical protein